MKIVCPNGECGQRIAIAAADAGTSGNCPGCGGAIQCPPIDDFPAEERPVAPAPPPVPTAVIQLPPRPPVAVRLDHPPATPPPMPRQPAGRVIPAPAPELHPAAARRIRMQALPGGNALLTGIGIFFVQLFLPALLIILGGVLARKPDDPAWQSLLITFIVFGIAQVLFLPARLIWRQGWARVGVFLILLLEILQVVVQLHTLRRINLAPGEFKTMVLSAEIIQWISFGSLALALLAIICLCFGLRAAWAVDDGDLGED